MLLAWASVLALAAAPKTTTATITAVRTAPLLAIYPSRVVETTRTDAEPISKERTLGFSSELGESAGAVFDWRRWEIAPIADVERAVSESDEECTSPGCRGRVAAMIGATHWMESTLTDLGKKVCRAEVRLYELPSNVLARSEIKDVRPCISDNLVAAALELGQKIAEGPRAPVQVTLNLTDLEVRSIDIPDVGEVRKIHTATAAKTRRGYELDRALEIYRAQHMIIVEDQGETFIARNGKLLTECDARLAASAPLPTEIREYCFGNDWDWAWLGLPAGGLIALGSFSGFQDGDLMGVVGFTIGLGSAITSAALAIALNENEKKPEAHVYVSSPEDLAVLVDKANDELRRTLDLTEAEVELAGLRK
jgi:hypothetical protein